MSDKKEMYAAMKSVIDATNHMDERLMVEGMLEALNGSHRTLQQTFFRVLNKAMKEYGTNYDKGRYDARNEASVIFAKKVGNMDEGFPFI